MPVASPGESDSGDAQSGAGIVAWLAQHGITAKIRAEVADDIDVGNLLLSRASDLATDLLVMGAYSRARLAERVAGGVTRVILESMTVPVLMSH
jgi:nucleotide-binding universal stress UspA family protein